MKRAEIALMIVVLGMVAWLSPMPSWETDRDIYERMSREWVVPGCNDFHCFRPLVPWVLGRIPGPPLVVWKTYAVICEAGAGFAPPVFGELAGRFVEFADLFWEVAETSRMHAGSHSVVQVYERWLQTGSRRSAELLAAQGIAPVGPGEGTRH